MPKGFRRDVFTGIGITLIFVVLLFPLVNKGAVDYGYDDNGNMVSDANKKISSISYNYLNLPEVIKITGKGTIRFVYDADGYQLQKVVTDNTVAPAKTTTTSYVDGFVYQEDTLQFAATEEGRIRPLNAAGQAAEFVYDYLPLTGDVVGGSHGLYGSSDNNPGSVLSGDMNQFFTDKEDNDYISSRPKAFLNWVAFDDQMKMEGDNSRVVQMPVITAGETGSLWLRRSRSFRKMAIFRST